MEVLLDYYSCPKCPWWMDEHLGFANEGGCTYGNDHKVSCYVLEEKEEEWNCQTSS